MSDLNLELYNTPHSTCSQKVRLALWEKGIAFEERHVDHKNREHLSDWYLELNPNGVVPTLTDGDDVIIVPSLDNEAAAKLFPEGWDEKKPYLRMVKQPKKS